MRKEGSQLVAEEQEKLQQQLKEEASQMYADPASGVRLRVSLVNQLCVGIEPVCSFRLNSQNIVQLDRFIIVLYLIMHEEMLA